MMPALLDTDVLSAIMRKNPLATERARAYLETHRQVAFSVITRYEVLRGLLVKGATKQLAAFDQLCATSRVFPREGGSDRTDHLTNRPPEKLRR